MEQVRVNLTLEQEVWGKFSGLVPKRKKSKIINELLRQETEKINRHNEEKMFALAFEDASKDKKRLAVISEWDHLDIEGWG